jgi:hypothetical protein
MSAGERETVVVAGPEICGACQQPRLSGHHDSSDKVFICSQCQADAEQLIRIQDAIWGDAHQRADAPPNINGQAV